MKLTENDVSKWFDFLGYGNPEAQLWFVGIEPGGPAACGPPQILEKWSLQGNASRKLYYDPKPSKEDRSPTWTMVEEILKHADCNRGDTTSQCIWERVMLANMAPLPRPSAGGDHGGMQQKDYVQAVRECRIPELKYFFDSLPGLRAMIFFGSTAWKRYAVPHAFRINTAECEQLDSAGTILVHKAPSERLVVLMPHPSYGHVPQGNRKVLAQRLSREPWWKAVS